MSSIRIVKRAGCSCNVGSPGKCSRCLWRKDRTIGYHVRVLIPEGRGGAATVRPRRVVNPDTGAADFDAPPHLFTRDAAFKMRRLWRDWRGHNKATVHRVLRREDAHLKFRAREKECKKLYVKCERGEATHVLVVKDSDAQYVGRVYPILKRDMNDVIVAIGDGKRRIVYEDEHEWRRVRKGSR